MPLLRVHRAHWRITRFTSGRVEGVLEQTASFLSSEVDPEVLEALLSRREERAEEIQKGLRHFPSLSPTPTPKARLPEP